MAFQAEGPHGVVPFTLKEVKEDTVTIDMNHPLCGERLHFKVKVMEVRQATEEEIAASHGCSHEQCTECGDTCAE